MSEKRREPRARALKGGKIIFDGSSIIDCTIRNRSEHGAQLKVPSLGGIPDQFELHEIATGVRRKVIVIWRRIGLLGVKFLDGDDAA